MQETRNERFKRLATARTNAVLDKLRLLGNLSSRSNYEYSEEEIRKIFSAIDCRFKSVRAKFENCYKKEFKL